jgi:hypothetical protein
VFDTIVAGLADDPDLLDLDTTTAEPDLSEPGPPGLAEDDAAITDTEEEHL